MHNGHSPKKGKKQFLIFLGNIRVAVTAVTMITPTPGLRPSPTIISARSWGLLSVSFAAQ